MVSESGEEVLFPNHKNEGDDGAAWFEDFPSEADANLIAAAPELLDALELLMMWVKNWDVPFMDDDEWCYDSRPQIEAAIAKARGTNEE